MRIDGSSRSWGGIACIGAGGLAAVLATAAFGGEALADEPPDDQAIELQLFQPAAGPQRFLTVSPATVMANKQFQLGLAMTYMTGGLVVYDVDAMDNLTSRTEVVSSILAGQIYGAYGFGDRFQVGLVLPITFSMTGEGLDPSTGNMLNGGLSVTGFGDATLEFAWRFYAQNGLSLTAIPAVSLPTSAALGGEGYQSGAFLGDDLPGFRPRAAAEWEAPGGQVTLGANLGFAFRKPRTLYSTEVGQQLTYGVAAAYHATDRVDVVGELFGRNGFSADVDANPLEGDAAVRVGVTNAITVLFGGGGGIISGLGAPNFRVFAAVSWSPDLGDTDGDGVNNMRDKCPFQVEDKDGFLDSDGCPEADNDDDKWADGEDKCPTEAEDKDGYEDDDGCPEVDNDKDGLADDKDRCPDDAEDKLAPYANDGCPATKRDSDDDGLADAQDKCPNDAEDGDGYGDEDGCPEADNDGDGIDDENDKCPAVAEDKDSFQDGDGCVDPDNDGDGIVDAKDKCVGEGETINGVNDWDGCPDRGGKRIAYMDGNRVAFGEGIAWDGARPKTRSTNLLDQAALTMLAETTVTKWRIVVAAEKQGGEEATRALSQQRADALKAYLVAKGMPADAIDALGVVGDSPTTAIVALERTEAEAPPAGDGEPAIEVEP
jgi:outer membrane protein OmpA-like peptidoglycan-associated protein